MYLPGSQPLSRWARKSDSFGTQLYPNWQRNWKIPTRNSPRQRICFCYGCRSISRKPVSWLLIHIRSTTQMLNSRRVRTTDAGSKSLPCLQAPIVEFRWRISLPRHNFTTSRRLLQKSSCRRVRSCNGRTMLCTLRKQLLLLRLPQYLEHTLHIRLCHT